MNKAELESKHLSELHELAAKAGIERYRMLRRSELIDKLSGGGDARPEPKREPSRQRQPRRRSTARQGQGGARQEGARQEGSRQRQASSAGARQSRQREEAAEPVPERPPAAEPARPKRKRRRRRWGRRRKDVRLQDLLLAQAPGRQAVVYASSRQECTELLREVAADLAQATQAPDPIALLVDPSPEELADWRRDAPRAEIVAAGQARHADDAVAQAVRRAESGEDVIVLIDSLSRFAEAYGGADAQSLFDSGRQAGAEGRGSLTVVAAVEKSE